MTEQSSNEQESDKQIDPVIQPFIDFWLGYIQKADEATKRIFQQVSGSADPQVWRKKWLAAVSQSLDAFMRSPAFLESMLLATQKVSQNEAFSQWQRFLHAPQAPSADSGQNLAVTPYDIVYEEGTLKLLRYRGDSEVAVAQPVLICFSLVNRPYILDLQEKRSVVRQLISKGFDVYLIDWGVPREADRTLRLYDYVCGFLKNVADFVCKQAGVADLNMLGYCMGGTMCAMFASLYPQQVRNLILMAAPIDFSGEESLLNVWTKEKYFDVDGLIDAYGNCPGPFLQASFQMMKPVQNFHEKYLGFFERKDDEEFLENFFAMERWANDNIPVAGETFREFVKMLYQQNLLVRGEMYLNDTLVNLKQIACPVLLLTADFDHLVPPSSTLRLKDHVGSKHVEQMSIDAGHIGLAVSSKAHEKLWPRAAEWIADHCDAHGDTSGWLSALR